jgi:hypothetical protein
MLDAPLLILDGGKSGDSMVDTLLTRKERSLRFKTKTKAQTKRTETSKLLAEVMTLDNNGQSFMSMNTLSQRKVR